VVASGRDGGALTSAMSALTLLCVDDFLTGRWDECAHLAEEGAGMCAAHGYRLLAAPLRLVQALLAAARGNYATTLALTCEVNEWAVPRGNRTLGWAVHHALTLGALADGDAERAYHHASAISPAGTLAPHNAPALWVALDLVEAAGRTGRVGEAVRHARAMRQAPLAAVSPRFAMLAAASAAMAASPDETAADLFEEALATVGGERWAFDHARVRLAYGEHLRRCRDTGSARRHLGAALATFRRLSADPWTARARDELRATGLTTDATRAAPGHHQPPSLTPEEREVTTFAASGLTNKQIAHRLHLSHHTVAARLYQVFPKLGVTSRAGLRDALAELSAAYDGVGP
jgi:DNA-binding CsgD family transcriptional regulator